MICFAAHPDDETIGAGGQLPYWSDVWVVHATDGAPSNMLDGRAHGFQTREAYAAARRVEAGNAMRLAGIPSGRMIEFAFPDQECCRHLAELAIRVVDLLRDLNPHTVLSPPYEGGHPDHDSLAFAVHAACRILERDGKPAPRVIEYSLYHRGPNGIRIGQFLPFPTLGSMKVLLNARTAALKRRMLECFTTQQATLAPFQTAYELFRIAPRYDFSTAPHTGELYYESFDWGATGQQWRELARQSAEVLGVPLPW